MADDRHRQRAGRQLKNFHLVFADYANPDSLWRTAADAVGHQTPIISALANSGKQSQTAGDELENRRLSGKCMQLDSNSDSIADENTRIETNRSMHKMLKNQVFADRDELVRTC